MSNQKSIIGEQYNANGLLAFDIETETLTRLGERTYAIVKEPYVAEGKQWCAMQSNKKVFVDVLDGKTERTYRIIYEPARIIENCNSEQQPKATKQSEFLNRAREIVLELKTAFETNDYVKENCSVVFMVNSANGDGKTSTGTSIIAGKPDRVAICIEAACEENETAFELIKLGTLKATLRRIFERNDKKK